MFDISIFELDDPATVNRKICWYALIFAYRLLFWPTFVKMPFVMIYHNKHLLIRGQLYIIFRSDNGANLHFIIVALAFYKLH